MLSWQMYPERRKSITDINLLKKLPELLIGHRRKKIKTCLAEHPEILALLAAADVDPDARGETLPVQKFVTLANLWAGQKD